MPGLLESFLPSPLGAGDDADYGDHLDTTPGSAAARWSRTRAVRGALALGALALSRLWWARAALRTEVEGPSMLPALAPGDRLLVARGLMPGRRPARRAGDLVVVRDPQLPARLLVKRIESLGASGIIVRGDNDGASRDSRTFGPVADELVVGRAWYRYAPRAHAGRLGRGVRHR